MGFFITIKFSEKVENAKWRLKWSVPPHNLGALSFFFKNYQCANKSMKL